MNTKFGGYYSGESGGIKCLIYHMTSRNNVIEGSYNFVTVFPFLYVSTLSNLVGIGIVAVKI